MAALYLIEMVCFGIGVMFVHGGDVQQGALAERFAPNVAVIVGEDEEKKGRRVTMTEVTESRSRRSSSKTNRSRVLSGGTTATTAPAQTETTVEDDAVQLEPADGPVCSISVQDLRFAKVPPYSFLALDFALPFFVDLILPLGYSALGGSSQVLQRYVLLSEPCR